MKAYVLIYEQEIIQNFCDGNSKNPSNLDSDFDTEHDKISKFTTVKANAGLATEKKNT